MEDKTEGQEIIERLVANDGRLEPLETALDLPEVLEAKRLGRLTTEFGSSVPSDIWGTIKLTKTGRAYYGLAPLPPSWSERAVQWLHSRLKRR
jgi:hypothetical protein